MPATKRQRPARRAMRIGIVLAAAAAAAATAASSLAAVALPAAAGATAGHTRQVVVRPVRRNGTPADGWRVHRERIPGFTCRSGPSRVAVDPNIRNCGGGVSETIACWKSISHTVLCMRNPRVHRLARIRYRGAFRPVRPPAHPSPQALRLATGNRCLIRTTGGWGPVRNHPRWSGTYSCTRGDIYGRGRDGIDRSVQPWRVHVVFNRVKPTIGVRRVATAYYAGTER